MWRVFEYSHLGGRQILQVDYPDIASEIEEVIDSIQLPEKTKIRRNRDRSSGLPEEAAEQEE